MFSSFEVVLKGLLVDVETFSSFPTSRQAELKSVGDANSLFTGSAGNRKKCKKNEQEKQNMAGAP